MTTTDFNSRFPKPWRFVMNEQTFSLRAANGQNVALLSLSNNHKGIPQKEWNRQVAAALREYLPVQEDGGGYPNRPQNQRPPKPAFPDKLGLTARVQTP